MKAVTQHGQFFAKLGVVVDLAVENDDGVAIVAAHRLLAAAQIDDLQPDSAKRNRGRFPNALLIGSAMGDGTSGLMNP